MKPADSPPMLPVEHAHRRLAWAWVLFFAGLLVGMTASKFSARLAYEAGLNEGRQSVQRASEALDAQREKVCLAWWFQESASRLVSAKQFMCKGAI